MHFSYILVLLATWPMLALGDMGSQRHPDAGYLFDQLGLQQTSFGLLIGSDSPRFPVTSPDGVAYNVADNTVEFSVVGPVVCFDAGKTGSVPRLEVTDVNGHLVIDFEFEDFFEYALVNDDLLAPTSAGTHCFFRQGPDETFKLQGSLDPGVLFTSRFQSDDPSNNLSLTITPTPEQARIDGTASYEIRLFNEGDSAIDPLAFQELYPANPEFFDAQLNFISSIQCTAGPDSSCGNGLSPPQGSPLTFIRVEDLRLGAGEEIVIEVERDVWQESTRGSTIELLGAAVALDGVGQVPQNAAAQAEILVVGDGSWISVADGTHESVVTDDTADGLTLQVEAFDSDNVGDDPIPLVGLEIEVASVCRIDLEMETCDPVSPFDVVVSPGVGMTGLTGVAEFQVAATVAGQYRIDFQVTDDSLNDPGLNASFDRGADQTDVVVEFMPGLPDYLQAVASPPASVQAGEVFGAEVMVRDEFGNQTACDLATPPALSIDLVDGNPAGDIIDPVSQSYDCGLITLSDVRVDQVGSGYALRLQASGLDPVWTADFDVVPGPASPLTSQVTASPNDGLIAGSESPSALEILLRDEFGNDLVAGEDPVGFQPLGAGEGTIGTVIDQGDGTYSATYTTGTVAGQIAIVPLLDGTPFTQTTSISVEPASASATTSTVIATPAELTADGESSSQLDIQLRDEFGNDLDSGGDSALISFVTPTQGSIDSQIDDNGDGSYQTTYYAGTVTGAVDIVPRLDGVDFANTTSITLLPGSASTQTSTVTAEPDTLTADGSSTSALTVELRDFYNNPLISGGDAVSFQSLDTGKGSIGPVTDLGDGSYTAIYTAGTIADPVEIVPLLDGSAFDNTAIVTLEPGAPDELRFADGGQPSDVVANETMNPPVAVEIVDAEGNVVTSSTLTVSLERRIDGGGTFQAAQTAVAGVATFASLSVPDSGQGYELRASISSPNRFVDSDPFDVSAAAFSFHDFGSLTKDTESAVSVTVDAEGNLDPSTLIRYGLVLTDAAGGPIVGQSFTHCMDGPGCTQTETIGPTDSSGFAWFGPSAGVTAGAVGITDPGGTTSHFLVTPITGGSQRLELTLYDWTDNNNPGWLGAGTHEYSVAVP